MKMVFCLFCLYIICCVVYHSSIWKLLFNVDLFLFCLGIKLENVYVRGCFGLGEDDGGWIVCRNNFGRSKYAYADRNTVSPRKI